MTYTWNIDPVAFSLFGLDVRWYGLVYIVGFLFTFLWIRKMWNQFSSTKLSKSDLEDVVFWTFFSGVIGGRLGEFLFFHPEVIWNNPLQILKIWEGGMSIQGGILFACIALFFWCRKHKVRLGEITDALVIPLSAALALGRIANFINGELVGRPTNSDWGVIFPHVDDLLRHPSQLYESGKNLLLVIILTLVFLYLKRKKIHRPGILTSIFITGYGILRFTIEALWRAPDSQFGPFSSGQWLSLVMIVIGVGIFFKVKNK